MFIKKQTEDRIFRLSTLVYHQRTFWPSSSKDLVVQELGSMLELGSKLVLVGSNVVEDSKDLGCSSSWPIRMQ